MTDTTTTRSTPPAVAGAAEPPDDGTPSYRKAHVHAREVFHDTAFAVRDAQPHHVRTLLTALRNTGRLEPILVWDDRRDPSRPRLVLLDGQHRLAAYANLRRGSGAGAGAGAKVPVRIVSCDEVMARRLSAQRNSRDKLPLTKAERLNLAWRLVWLKDAVLSKAEIVSDTGASRSTVGNMRHRRQAMIAAGAQETGDWFRDRRDGAGDWQPDEGNPAARIASFTDALLGPATGLRRESLEVQWAVMEAMLGVFGAKCLAEYGAGESDEFDPEAMQPMRLGTWECGDEQHPSF